MCDLCNVAAAGVPAVGLMAGLYRHRLVPIVRFVGIKLRLVRPDYINCDWCGGDVREDRIYGDRYGNTLCKTCYRGDKFGHDHQQEDLNARLS